MRATVRKTAQTELAVESSVHVEDFDSAGYLELCARQKRNEVRIYGVAVSKQYGKIWRVQWEIITTPDAAAVPELPREVKAVQTELL